MPPFLHPTYIISILIAIAVHEWAHAFTATRLGDSTPAAHGRLTINPLAHIDPIGALMFLVVGFGWAKPVPVNPLAFRRPRSGMALTALAGPLSNLILASITFFLAVLIAPDSPQMFDDLFASETVGPPWLIIAQQILTSSIFVNLGLMAFNLFPIAPLDGSSIVRIFIPLSMEDSYERFVQIGPYVLLFLLLFESFLPVPFLTHWVRSIVEAVLSVFTLVAGLA